MLFVVNEAGQGIRSDRLAQDHDNLTMGGWNLFLGVHKEAVTCYGGFPALLQVGVCASKVRTWWLDVKLGPAAGERELRCPTDLIIDISFRTVASWDTQINTQMPYFRRLQGGALWLPKSEGPFADLARWRMDTWYLLPLDRKVATQGLVENSPRHSFSTAWTQG